MLTQDRRNQLDDIVVKMHNEGATPEEAKIIVDDFTAKFDVPEPQIPQKEQTPGFLGKAARFTGGEALGRGIGKSLFSLTKEAKDLDRMLQAGEISPEEYESIRTGGLTGKEVIGSAIQTAATLAPGASKGAKFLSKVGIGAGTGYAFDVAGNLQKEKGGVDILKPGLGTAVGVAIPIVSSILGYALAKSPRKLEELNMRLTPVEKQNLAKQGKDIASYMADKKIIGSPQTRYAKVKTLYDDMETKITDLVKKSDKVYKKSDIIKELKNIPEQFADDPAGYNEASQKVKSIIGFIEKKADNDIPAWKLNSYKRNLFKRAYSKNNTDVINETYHAIGSLFKKNLDDAIKPLNSLNKEYGLLITSKRALFKATTRPQLGLIGKGVSAGAGAVIGTAIGGPGGAAAGAILGPTAGKIIAGTGARSLLGAGLKTIQETINKIPADKIGNLQITRKALLDLIQQYR